jgi:uncharacterized protein (TIGR00730 family)
MKICVFGAAGKSIDEKYIVAVEKMGEALAKRGHSLVFGAGSTGCMGAAERGFRRGGSTVHGVVPEFFKQDLSEFVDWDCDELTLTKTMRDRKMVMEDLADAFIVTPGGAGTFEEFFEVLTLKQLGQHRKPIAMFNVDGYYDSLISTIEYSISLDFIKPKCRTLYKLFDEIEPMIDYIENDSMNGFTVHDLK